MTSLLLFLISLSLGYTFCATYCTWVFFKRNRQAPENPEKAFPPVSILKPLSGLEGDALKNLMSFCEQDYPSFEIVFSLDEKEESMISLLEDLKRVLPHMDIRWVITEGNQGPNYKVGNLLGALREAKYDLLAISDGDMRVNRDYLKKIVALLLEEKAGLVTCLYRGRDIRNIFTGLQSLSVQTDFIPNVLLGRQLEGISYAFGATILTSRKILSSFGGLEPLRQYLADDYQMGNRVQRKGFGVALSPYLVDHFFHTKNFRQYFLHHLRWAVTQRVCRPKGYFASFLTQGVSLSLIFMILEGFSSAAVALLLFICGIRVLSFLFLNKTVIRNDEVTRYFWLVPFHSLIGTAFWVLSLFTNTVHWKNRRFRILRGGRIAEL